MDNRLTFHQSFHLSQHARPINPQPRYSPINPQPRYSPIILPNPRLQSYNTTSHIITNPTQNYNVSNKYTVIPRPTIPLVQPPIQHVRYNTGRGCGCHGAI